MYSLMRGVPEDSPDMVQVSCREHVLDLDFVFEPHHGLPEKILDLQTGKYCPSLVKRIARLYEERQQNK